MATQDLERLVVQLSADLKGYENAMKKAQGITDKRAKAIESRFTSMNSKVAATATALTTRLAAGLAGVGIAGAVGGFREVASSVADIGAEAQRAGLSAKAFQELKFAAEQSRITVDALTDGMKELSLRADEFIVSGGKTGSAAEAFKRLGYNVDQLKVKIKDPSALLSEIVGKVQKLDKAAQVRIFDELFGGTGGEQFVRFIDRGEAGIRDAVKAANELGIVINDDVIAKAAEVDRQFNVIASTISGNLKSAIIDAFSALASFVDQYRDITNQSNKTLDGQISDLGMKRLATETRILEIKERQRELERAGMLNPIARGVIDTDLQQYQRQLATIGDQEAALVNERNKRVKLNPVVVPPAGSGTYNGGNAVPSSGGSDPWASALKRLREREEGIRAETAAQAELNPLVSDYGFALAKAQVSQDLLNAANEAGLKITPTLAETIDQLATGYANASVESERLAESQDRIRESAEEWKGTAKDITSGFISDLRSGTSAAEALANALDKVVDKLIDASLNSIFGLGGGGGGIFSLFGFAKGGIAANGKPMKTFARGGVSKSTAIFGEAGPEAAVPLPDGRSIPVKFQQPAIPRRQASAAGPTIHNSYQIDARGADQAAVARLERGLAERDRTFGNRVAGVRQNTDVRKIRPR